MFADALEKGLYDRGRQRRILEKLPDIAREQIEIGMVRSAGEKAVETARNAGKGRAQAGQQPRDRRIDGRLAARHAETA